MNANVITGFILAVLIALTLWSTFRRHGPRRMWRDLSAGVLFFLVYPIAALFIGAATNMIIALALIVVWVLPLNFVREHGFEGLGLNAKTFQSFRRDAFWLVVMSPVALLLNFVFQEVIAALKSAS